VSKAIKFSVALLANVIALSLSAHAAERWKIQFFYDKPEVTLAIQDLTCPSANHCIAAGAIEDKKGHSKGVVLWTSDAGKDWNLEDVNEEPISLFFLNDTAGWMVSIHGLWSTGDGGRTWKKSDAPKKGILESYFVSPQHGYLIGFPKAVYETNDAGKKWTKLAAAEQLSIPENTVFECISFLGQHGLIIGNGRSADETPVWMDPRRVRAHREHPSTLVVLETKDGGAKWDTYTSSFLGKLTQLVMTDQDYALALFEYLGYYTLPSRVYKAKFPTNMQPIFEERDRAVSDIALLPSGVAYLAAVEPPGGTNQVPIPGKLKILRSSNLKVWEEMDIDYRANAQRAFLAAPDDQHAWVATDTGMILTLDDTQAGSSKP